MIVMGMAMVFLEVLLALAIERLWVSVTAWRRFTWFMRFAAWSETRVAASSASTRSDKSADTHARMAVLLAILAPVLGVGLAHYLLSEMLLVLVLIFDVAVLVYCLGPKDLDAQVRAFMQACIRDDPGAARQHMADITGRSWHPAAHGTCRTLRLRSSLCGDTDIAPEAPLTLPQMMQGVIEAILIQANERWFAIIFWFFVLGPMGALFYRLASVLKDHAEALRSNKAEESGEPDSYAAAAQQLHAILGWLPARFTALSYAVMGSFVDAIDGWSQGIYDPLMNRSSRNADVVMASGLGALRMHDMVHDMREMPGAAKKTISILHVRSALALVWRTVMFCLWGMLVASLMSWLI